MAPDEPLSTQVGTELLYEDDHVRVWLLQLAPGQATDWHRHECDYAFVVTQSGSVCCEYVNGSTDEQINDPVGSTQYRSRDTPHRLQNIGMNTYQNIVVEFKGIISVDGKPANPTSS